MMVGMTTRTRSATTASPSASPSPSPSSVAAPAVQITVQPELPEQLSLLAPSDGPLQFRLDRRTRERGLAHIAAIRHQLAAHGHVSADDAVRPGRSDANRHAHAA